MRASKFAAAGVLLLAGIAAGLAQGGPQLAPGSSNSQNNSLGQNDQGIKPLLGRWCTSVAVYTFSETKLVVAFPDGSPPRTLEVDDIKTRDGGIHIFWKPPYKSTVFNRFAPDNQTMEQPPTTDGGPLRTFKRC